MQYEDIDIQDIVGSAELLTDEETRKRLQELKDWGVDLSLVEASLSRTPTERVTRMLDLLEFAQELRRGYLLAQAKSKDKRQEHKDLLLLPQIEATLRLREEEE